jgi:hypothetical protein
LVVGLFFRGDDTDKFGEFFAHEKPDFTHVGVNAQDDTSVRIKVVADQFFLSLRVFADRNLSQYLFKGI